MSLLTGFLLLAALFPLESIQVEGLKRLKPGAVVAMGTVWARRASPNALAQTIPTKTTAKCERTAVKFSCK